LPSAIANTVAAVPSRVGIAAFVLAVMAVLALLWIGGELHRQSCMDNAETSVIFQPEKVGPSGIYGPAKGFLRTARVKRDTTGCDVHPF
jgi:hypothetical protein